MPPALRGTGELNERERGYLDTNMLWARARSRFCTFYFWSGLSKDGVRKRLQQSQELTLDSCRFSSLTRARISFRVLLGTMSEMLQHAQVCM